MSQRIVIVAGGCWSEEEAALLRSDDMLVGVDAGAVHLLEAGRVPDLVVGDFDTVSVETYRQLQAKGVPIHSLPTAKDVTDTHHAVDWALARRPQQILLLGALGGSRFDHALANLFLLERMADAGISGLIQDAHNRIQLHPGNNTVITVEASPFRYLSLLALTTRVEGVTLRGFRYPLQEAVLIRDFPLGISNELEVEKGHIQVRTGKLLLIESRDHP
ncbi:thiamine diphosphokinase [Desmospora activa]|uniref:Thiamine diphosphokinase n=1 Tax=Desmospora activa DSM 45169 TaxID=1121389 RepID=A0A2T4ZB48_9BACL|nr:thiamine diphosphokinase [Desmospora activa]PTM59123.1 thiamine pyrophosphokinase [Desmospora activa DSM 45169]